MNSREPANYGGWTLPLHDIEPNAYDDPEARWKCFACRQEIGIVGLKEHPTSPAMTVTKCCGSLPYRVDAEPMTPADVMATFVKELCK